MTRLASRKPTLAATVQRVFGLSPVEASLLLGLLKCDYVNKSCISGMAPKCADVHICRMGRQLEPHAIAIQTLWGCGYRLSPSDRHRAMGMILSHAGDAVA